MTDAVWITPGYPWEEQPVGGIFHQTQAQALARHGLAVTVVSPTPWAPWPLPELRAKWRHYARAPQFANDGRVRVVRPRYLNAPGQPGWALPDRLIARAAWRVRDQWAGSRVVHGHSIVEGLAAWRLAQRAGLPYVLTFHGSDINTWPFQHPDRVDDLREAARSAGAVFAVSAALADGIHALTGVDAIHLPIGSDHRALANSTRDKRDARRVLGLPDDRVIALFVGHLLGAKGVRELADAILSLGDPFVGIFVGGGPEAGYGTGGDGDDGRLTYTGERRHEEVVLYMSAADLLVLPSRSEGLPTVLVEAGSLGLPVLASAVGGIPELLGNDRGAMLPDPSADAIADGLRRFAADRRSADLAARRLHEYVMTNHDVEANTLSLVGWYRRVSAYPVAP